MGGDLYDLLSKQNELSGRHFWACDSCQSTMAKVNKRLVDMEKKIETISGKVDSHTEKLESVEDKIDNISKDVQSVKDNQSKMNVPKDMLTRQEMREMEAKKDNLIMHQIPEADASVGDAKERQRRDKEQVGKVLGDMSITIDWAKDIKFITRVGDSKKRNLSSIRPMLIGFKNRAKRDEILDNARTLAETDHNDIRIVPDLTKKQRQDDANIRAECDKLNEKMSEEDFLVWEWRPVGQKGMTTKARVRKRQQDVNNRHRRRSSTPPDQTSTSARGKKQRS